VSPEVDLCAWSLAELARVDETLARARRFSDDSGYPCLAPGGHLLSLLGGISWRDPYADAFRVYRSVCSCLFEPHQPTP
jgi:hypothetical protein